MKRDKGLYIFCLSTGSKARIESRQQGWTHPYASDFSRWKARVGHSNPENGYYFDVLYCTKPR